METVLSENLSNFHPSTRLKEGRNPMKIPKILLYTKEHEWVLIEDDLAVVGITDYAQSEDFKRR